MELVDVAGVEPDVVSEVEREAAGLLARLIRIDTSNPPGNETAAAEVLDEYFRECGLRGEIVGEPANRRSFVLRLEGGSPGPTLVLLAHTDVVPAEAEKWSVPPFSGEVRDDYVRGRGAADIKNLVAAHAVAVRRLAAAGRPFAGTVVYAATADEEEGSVCGARWLVENRPDLVRCDYLLNEGGGEFVCVGGGRVYDLNTGEKGTAQFRLIVRGEAGHASVPLRDGNAVVAAADVIRALHEYRPRLTLEHVSREYVEAMVEDPEMSRRLLDEATAREALVALGERDQRLARLLEPLYGITLAPTVVHSSSVAVNVYPQEVRLDVDCRTLAGHSEDEVLDEVRGALAGVDAEWELEWISVVRGNASPYPTSLGDAIVTVMDRMVPGARVVPVHCVGFTDSNWFRAAFTNIVAYGYGPYLVEEGETVTSRYHNVDERIHVRDLAFQTIFAENLVRELLR